MRKYKHLDIWNKAILLVDEIYTLTKSFPKDEMFGLSQQMRRAAVSVPSNIAEGAGRNSELQFIQFLSIASGSATELETQLIISSRQNYISDEQLESTLKLIDDIQKMNYKLQNKLNGR